MGNQQDPLEKELEVHDGKDKIKGKLYGYGKHGELLSRSRRYG